MCFAVPGKVVEIYENEALIDYGGEEVRAVNFFELNLGDFVIVSNKVVVRIVPESEVFNEC